MNNDGDGAVNEPGEPSRGASNRLFARIRNLGSNGVGNVGVRFAFAPYGLWSPGSLADFKEITVVTVPTLGAMGSGDDEKTIEVEWDLSDLTEDNGGAWGGSTINDFDHFCVLVILTAANDSNFGNNLAQNNFVNLPITLGKEKSIKFMIANPKAAQATAEVLVTGLPPGWRGQLMGGVQQGGQFLMQAREVRPVTLTFTPTPEGGGQETVLTVGRGATSPLRAHVDVSLRLDGEIVGGVSFDASEPGAGTAADLFAAAGGSLSPYIIGTYDLRARRRTSFQILNPTGRPLRVLVAFFDADEKPLACVRDRLSPNDLLEIYAHRHVRAPLGVVKIVALDEEGERPVAGVVGYQRTFWRGFLTGYRSRGETILHALPAEVLAGDMEMIRRACP